VSGPLCGSLYTAQIPGARATHLLVLTEDLWNDRVGDSVVVPVFPVQNPTTNDYLVEIEPGFIADCTRVQSIPHEYFGQRVGTCSDDSWDRTRVGVRKHLDIDNRIARRPRARVKTARRDWWPRQREIFFASRSEMPQDKLYGVVSDDAWNSRPAATYCTTVRLTSTDSKAWRRRWKVPVTGGWVVSGDLYLTAYQRMDQTPPHPKKYPTELSEDESAEIARRQKTTFTLT
jgi:mRNA-degrading endonuclease toxin of MazEF toxin-antitoxin module